MILIRFGADGSGALRWQAACKCLFGLFVQELRITPFLHSLLKAQVGKYSTAQLERCSDWIRHIASIPLLHLQATHSRLEQAGGNHREEEEHAV